MSLAPNRVPTTAPEFPPVVVVPSQVSVLFEPIAKVLLEAGGSDHGERVVRSRRGEVQTGLAAFARSAAVAERACHVVAVVDDGVIAVADRDHVVRTLNMARVGAEGQRIVAVADADLIVIARGEQLVGVVAKGDQIRRAVGGDRIGAVAQRDMVAVAIGVDHVGSVAELDLAVSALHVDRVVAVAQSDETDTVAEVDGDRAAARLIDNRRAEPGPGDGAARVVELNVVARAGAQLHDVEADARCCRSR